jgi:hypothetical protein
MGGSSSTGILSAVITAVAVAAAVFTGGTSLYVAAAWGAAAGAAMYVATSSLTALSPNVTGYGDTATTLTRSTDPQSGMPILYGGTNANDFCKVGSIVPWYNVLNESSQYLYTEHAIAMGEVGNLINQIYIDDEPVLANQVGSEGIIPESSILEKFRPYLQLEVRFGKPQYSGSKSLGLQYGGSRWNNNFKGNGVVQIGCVIKKTQSSLENDILTNDNYVLTVEIKGKLIRDLNTMEISASSNPPSQLYDFLTNTVYGMSIDPNNIDLQSFRTAANYCLQYGFNSVGNISYGDSYKANIEKILMTFGGVTYIHAGKLYLTLDIPGSSVASFDESNMFGNVKITTSGTTDYFNCIDASWTNIQNSYSTDVIRIPSDISQSEVIESDGTIIPKAMAYEWVHSKDQLTYLVNIELLKSKYSHNTLVFTTDSAWDLQVWSVITVNFPEYGIVNKQYRVYGKEITTSVENVGMMTLTCLEYNQGIYEGVDPGVFPVDGQVGQVISVLPPSNLQAVKKGGTISGNVVTLSWTASPDQYLRGYYIYYRPANAALWTYGGAVNQYVNVFDLFNLDPSINYDFGVAAYNNLGFLSERITILNIKPEYEFTLPQPTNLVLLNNDLGGTNTTSGDFLIGWADQSALLVNNLPFNQYFSKYQIKVYNTTGVLLNTYYSTTNQFNYTFQYNKADGTNRSVILGVTALGRTTGTYSQETLITVKNPQAPLIQGLIPRTAIGQIVFEWSDVNQPKDYAGVYIQVSNTENFSSIEKNYISTNRWGDWVVVPDGQYYLRAGMIDIFGTDEIQWSTTIPFLQQTSVPFSQLNNDVVDGILASSEFNQVKQEIIDDAKYTGWQLSVNNNGYVAGIALASSGTESLFTVVADRFSIISTGTAANNTKVYPFVVQNGTTYMNNAMIQNAAIGTAQIQDGSINSAKIINASIQNAKIQDGAITNAKIADAQITNAKIQDAAITNGKISGALYSDNYPGSNGTQGWYIDKAGGFQMGTQDGNGRVALNGNGLLVIDGNGVVRVQIGRL